MHRAFSVSQLYDETGSANARHYEALQAAQARILADLVKGDDGRLISRVLVRLHAGLVAAGSNLGSRRERICSLRACDAQGTGSNP